MAAFPHRDSGTFSLCSVVLRGEIIRSRGWRGGGSRWCRHTNAQKVTFPNALISKGLLANYVKRSRCNLCHIHSLLESNDYGLHIMRAYIDTNSNIKLSFTDLFNVPGVDFRTFPYFPTEDGRNDSLFYLPLALCLTQTLTEPTRVTAKHLSILGLFFLNSNILKFHPEICHPGGPIIS